MYRRPYPHSRSRFRSLGSERSVSPIGDPTNSNSEGSQPWYTPSRLLFFHKIPSWQQDNEYILSGYRPTSGSVWRSLTSLFYLHNQTVNAYSHLIGAAVFIALSVYFHQVVYKFQANRHVVDLVVVFTYCLGVAVCFLFSATFHILWNHNLPLTSFCNKLDYLGILILMWGAGIPTIYYGFFCNESLRLLYWSSTSGTALSCAILTLDPHFASPKFRSWRACFYAGFGLSSIIFVVHGLLVYGWAVQKSRMWLVWMGWMATSNLVGAAIYAARIPERWAPRLFDICGASHQISHVAVMVAAYIHFDGIVSAFRFARSQPGACSVV
ncbi:hypothetical protein PG999_005608 [Apiospora kogelbergensis]|uniref:Uncharacterized protein n=1 Tax=Apiospora kogelbergensis TaxID=1337665 RepID=A0AAW0R2N9_9PEZI